MPRKATGRPTGVRLNKRQADSVRSHIQTDRILDRLQKYGEGEIELTSGQVRAYELLLSKSLPSLSSTEMQVGRVASTPDEMSDDELAEAIEAAKGKISKLGSA